MNSCYGLPINKAAETDAQRRSAKSKLSRRMLEQFCILKRNWAQFRTFIHLTYGRVKSNYYAPHNRSIIRKVGSLIKRLVYTTGVYKGMKELSFEIRQRALEVQVEKVSLRGIRGKESYPLFLASTLSRGVSIPVDKSRVSEEVQQAFIRLTQKRQVIGKGTKDRLSKYIKHLVKSKKLDKLKERCQLPIPSVKSCVQLPASKGGCFKYIYDKYKTETDDQVGERYTSTMIRLLNDRTDRLYYRARAVESQEHEDAYDQYMASEEVQKAILQIDSEISSENLPNSLDKMFLAALGEESESDSPAECFPLIMEEGKIRVPTVHTAEAVWAARALTAFLIPILKRIGVSRDMLKNLKVTLENNQSSSNITKLYSADLSKSTDPISIATARFVMNELKANLKVPHWWDTAIDCVFRSFKLKNRLTGEIKDSTCGAFMGLGPSWTVLTILNSFAAYDAGAPMNSFKVCGDDLIGLWKPETIKAYQDNIVRLHLENNISKSFISASKGVFCERLVVKRGNKAVARQCMRIGEASGMRAITGKKGQLIVDQLMTLKPKTGYQKLHKEIRFLSVWTAHRLSFNKKNIAMKGMYQDGGNGFSKPNKLTILSYIQNGPISLDYALTKSEKMNTQLSLLREKLKTVSADVSKDSDTGITAEDILTSAKQMLRDSSQRSGEITHHKHKQVSKPQISSQIKNRYKQSSKALKKAGNSLIKAVKTIYSSTNTSMYARFDKNILRRVLHGIRRKKYQKVMKLLKTSWRIKLSSSDAILALSSVVQIEQNFNLELKPVPFRWDLNTQSV